jgi:hypothetical protein
MQNIVFVGDPSGFEDLRMRKMAGNSKAESVATRQVTGHFHHPNQNINSRKPEFVSEIIFLPLDM